MNRSLLCFAQGHEDAWEAICLDLDLAVQGVSLADVERSLVDAIDDYLDAIKAEPVAARRKLLERRSPFGLRVWWLSKFAFYILFRGRGEVDALASFPVVCPA